MKTSLHHLLESGAYSHSDDARAHVRGHDTYLRRALARRDEGRRRPGRARRRAGRSSRGVPRQADRDGRVDLRDLGRGRRLRTGESAAACRAGRPHPGGLRRHGFWSRPPNARHCWRDELERVPTIEHVVVVGATTRTSRRTARLSAHTHGRDVIDVADPTLAPRSARSTSTSPPSCTPREARAGPRAWCSATAT